MKTVKPSSTTESDSAILGELDNPCNVLIVSNPWCHRTPVSGVGGEESEVVRLLTIYRC